MTNELKVSFNLKREGKSKKTVSDPDAEQEGEADESRDILLKEQKMELK